MIYEVRGFWNLSNKSSNYDDISEAVQEEISACHKADRCVAISRGIADVLVKGLIEYQSARFRGHILLK